MLAPVRRTGEGEQVKGSSSSVTSQQRPLNRTKDTMESMSPLVYFSPARIGYNVLWIGKNMVRGFTQFWEGNEVEYPPSRPYGLEEQDWQHIVAKILYFGADAEGYRQALAFKEQLYKQGISDRDIGNAYQKLPENTKECIRYGVEVFFASLARTQQGHGDPASTEEIIVRFPRHTYVYQALDVYLQHQETLVKENFEIVLSEPIPESSPATLWDSILSFIKRFS